MSTPQPDAQEVQRYIELLYPDPPRDAWLVVSWLTPANAWRSQWFKAANLDKAAQCIARKTHQANVYIGIGLRDPTCTPAPEKRGTSDHIYALAGLWIELDHNAGVHAAPNLPTPDELRAFIAELLFQFTLIIDSTGGSHGYVLFKELWILDTPEEHQKAALLLRRFQRTIQARAAERGWKVDSTADLARVLRPAGTLNHKSGTPKPVTILHEAAIRYNPSDIADAAWLATIEDTYATPIPQDGISALARLDLIVTGCAWIRHCQEDAKTLPEPEWYAMLGIVGRCEDGEQVAHDWSMPYPRYSKAETARKLQHALNDKGVWTCSTIRFDLAADDYCKDCQHWKRVKSPLVLGRPAQWGQQGPGDADSPPEPDPDEPIPEEPTSNRQRAHAQTAQVYEAWVLPPEPVWPQCAPEAFHGVLGAIVMVIDPHTESDPIAILLQLMVMAGNAIGRSANFPVEASKHYANLFAACVGETSRGRKGTSAAHPQHLVTTIDTAWGKRVKAGLSSGEGVIWNVRDQTLGVDKRGAIVVTDPGESDKRLCILDTEFARGLSKIAQDGNVLSAVLRQAWDHGDLNTLVSGRQKAPVQATGAHMSVIAHITANELRRCLTDTEAANGFGNRFLWVCVKRSKLLPEGRTYPEKDLAPLRNKLGMSIEAARKVGKMTRTDAARTLWAALYTKMAEGAPGLVGAMTARLEAQVLRLSMLYALCDQKAVIDVEHLLAAYALWQYCEASVRYIFGESLGDALADTILQALRVAGNTGVPPGQISAMPLDATPNNQRSTRPSPYSGGSGLRCSVSKRKRPLVDRLSDGSSPKPSHRGPRQHQDRMTTTLSQLCRETRTTGLRKKVSNGPKTCQKTCQGRIMSYFVINLEIS